MSACDRSNAFSTYNLNIILHTTIDVENKLICPINHISRYSLHYPNEAKIVLVLIANLEAQLAT